MLLLRAERNPAVAVQERAQGRIFAVIRAMQTELRRTHHTPRDGHSRSGTLLIRRYMAWAGLVVIAIVAGLAFDAGVSGALGHTAVSHEYVASPVSHTDRQQDGSQFEGSPLSRVCWPIEAGVDAQCFDRP